MTDTHRIFLHNGGAVISSLPFSGTTTPKLLHPAGGAIGGAGPSRGFGKFVSYSEPVGITNNRLRNRFFLSDGENPSVFLLDSSATYDVGSLRYAHSHIAWLRGSYPNQNNYERTNIELWASPYAEKQADLQPKKLVSLPGVKFVHAVDDSAVAGHGHFAIYHPNGSSVWDSILVVNLQTGATQTLKAPKNYAFTAIDNISKTHVWVEMEDTVNPVTDYQSFARYALAGG